MDRAAIHATIYFSSLSYLHDSFMIEATPRFTTGPAVMLEQRATPTLIL